MKKVKQQKENKKTYGKLLIFVFVIIFLVASLRFVGYMNERSDRARFDEASKVQRMVFEEFTENLDTSIQTVKKDICYNSGQGPWDNGHLWCQVASAMYLSNEELSESQIRNEFEAILKAKQLEIKRGPSGEIAFYGADDLLCNLTIYSGSLARNPGFRFPNNLDAKQTLLVYCADRAKAKHYPYTN